MEYIEMFFKLSEFSFKFSLSYDVRQIKINNIKIIRNNCFLKITLRMNI